MSREHLSTKTRESKMGFDNTAMDDLRLQIETPAANGIPGVEVRRVAEGVGGDSSQQHDSKEYDPYDHRVVSHPTTYWETLFHMLKASLGTGILAMPKAFSQSGYVIGTIGTLVIGLLCTYTIHILIASEYELCRRKKKPSMTYPETATAAVSCGPACLSRVVPWVPGICNTFLLMYQIGSCCIYVVFIASNIKDVVDHHIASEVDVRWFMFAITLPLVLINLVRNLKYLAPLSTIANGITLVSFIIIFYYVFQELPNISTNRRPVGETSNMPLFFGTVLFAMEAIGVVMPLENEMKSPRKFGSAFGVLNCAMLPITLLYTFVGFFGYLKYGDKVEGSITLDLPKKDVLAQAVRLMLASAIYVTHALALYVAYDIFWREYISSRATRRPVLCQYVLRIVLVLVTVLLAVAIPDLDLFISLVGALCLSTMGLSFPALVQLFTYWHDLRGVQFVLFLLKNTTIIVIALLGFIIGTYTSIDNIRRKLFS